MRDADNPDRASLDVGKPTEIQTRFGATIDLREPRPLQIDRHDVAHALSMTCRFGGHSRQFYSVAEHAVLCYVIAKRDRESTPTSRLAALHHDDAEAYIGDVPSPLKPLLGEDWSRLEDRWNLACATAAGFPAEFLGCDVVKRADYDAVTLEGARLMGDGWGWSRERCREELLCTLQDVATWWPGLMPHDAMRLYLEAAAEADDDVRMLRPR